MGGVEEEGSGVRPVLVDEVTGVAHHGKQAGPHWAVAPRWWHPGGFLDVFVPVQVLPD